MPSLTLEPPYPVDDRPFPIPVNASRNNDYFPPVPSIDSHHQDTRANSTFPIGWQIPTEPVVQPPQPSNEPMNHDTPNPGTTDPDERPGSSSNFQPSSQLTPPNFTPNVTGQYPNVPSSNLEPPYEEPSYGSSSTTQRIAEDPDSVPPKKRFLQNEAEKKTTTTTQPSVPIESMDEENSTKPDYPDIVEPDLEDDVDLLDDKKIWKPVLVFENKTQATTESSAIMKINKKKVDIDLFNIEAPPFEEGKLCLFSF